MARRTHELDGCPVKAGETIMVMPGAANRDERRFERPDEFRIDRATCAITWRSVAASTRARAGPLVRAEARISLNRVLDRLGDIRISEDAPRTGGRPSLRLEAVVHAPRPRGTAPRVHAARLSSGFSPISATPMAAARATASTQAGCRRRGSSHRRTAGAGGAVRAPVPPAANGGARCCPRR